MVLPRESWHQYRRAGTPLARLNDARRLQTAFRLGDGSAELVSRARITRHFELQGEWSNNTQQQKYLGPLCERRAHTNIHARTRAHQVYRGHQEDKEAAAVETHRVASQDEMTPKEVVTAMLAAGEPWEWPTAAGMAVSMHTYFTRDFLYSFVFPFGDTYGLVGW